MVIEIYELTDSAGLCRYVGQSRTAKKRHRWHVQAAHRGERGRQYTADCNAETLAITPTGRDALAYFGGENRARR